MTSPTTIYMPLLEEGTEVWRPVEAEPLESGLYLVMGPVPDDEIWRFPPGTVVRCELLNLAGEHGELRQGLVPIEALSG